MGKLTAEQKVREYNRGQKAAREGRSRSWSEPWAYPFESNQHYEERREAFNQGYGIIDATPMSVRRSLPRGRLRSLPRHVHHHGEHAQYPAALDGRHGAHP